MKKQVNIYLKTVEKDGKSYNNIYIEIADGLLTIPVSVKIFDKDGKRDYSNYNKLVKWLVK